MRIHLPQTGEKRRCPTRKTYFSRPLVGEDLLTITAGEAIEVGKAVARER